MELREFLATKGDDIVAIGAEDGSSLMYIGEASNLELIEKVFYDHYIAEETKLSTLNETLYSLVIDRPRPVEGKPMRDVVRERAKKVSNMLSRIEGIESYLRHYEPVLDRRVLEDYHKDVDNCQCIIIQGEEVGKFWFKSEFDEVYKK